MSFQNAEVTRSSCYIGTAGKRGLLLYVSHILGINIMTFALITTTFETTEDAERLATLLLENKLIACAQISAPIASLYRWNEKIATETEYTLGVKTRIEKVREVQQVISNEHPYELPEILINTSIEANSEYLEWLKKEVQ